MSIELFFFLFAGLPAIVGFSVAYILSLRYGELTRFTLFFVSPFVIAAAMEFSLHMIWDPNPGCTEECEGRIVYLVATIAMVAGAELGTVGGWFHAYLRQRHMRAS